MREYAIRLERLGISYDRYRELVHFCRQYKELSEAYRSMIEEAAEQSAGEYSTILIKTVCEGELPYRYLDIPYSEAQYKRIRRQFFRRLHELKK